MAYCRESLIRLKPGLQERYPDLIFNIHQPGLQIRCTVLRSYALLTGLGGRAEACPYGTCRYVVLPGRLRNALTYLGGQSLQFSVDHELPLFGLVILQCATTILQLHG